MKTQRRRGMWSVGIAFIIMGGILYSFIDWPDLIDAQNSFLTEEPDESDVLTSQDSDEESSSELLTVELHDEAIEIAGVKTIELTQTSWSRELKVPAKVIDSQSLVFGYTQLLQLQAAVHVAEVATSSAKDEYDRLLKVSGAVAKKNINYAKAEWLNQQAQLMAARTDYQNRLTEFTFTWGDVITTWFDEANSPFKKLLDRESVLVEVGLPFSANDAGKPPIVFVSMSADREMAFKTDYVSPAFNSAQLANSQTHFYLCSAKGLRPNMRLHAWMQQEDRLEHGFFIPEESIVWYAGQPWSYVEMGDGIYQRRPLNNGTTRADGIFIQTGFNEGDELVLSGAQMLLSEEFRWQIHDEDDDD